VSSVTTQYWGSPEHVGILSEGLFWRCSHYCTARSSLLETLDDDAILLAFIAVIMTQATCAQGSQPKLRRTNNARLLKRTIGIASDG
jgi:hypothetical protein